MIKHIVFFKLSNETLKDEVVSKLKNLKNDINFIRELEVGVNFSTSLRAFDIALTVILDSQEDLKTYATHPKHLPVVEFLKENNIETKVVDYEFIAS